MIILVHVDDEELLEMLDALIDEDEYPEVSVGFLDDTDLEDEDEDEDEVYE